MINPYKYLGTNPTGLIRNWYPVDGAKDAPLVTSGGVPFIAIGLYVSVGGTLSFADVDGNTVDVSVPDNFYVNCSVSQVNSSGTTATGVFALNTA